jgi:octaprenyl-diphosphate synthase
VLFGDCLFARALTLAASFPTPDICRAVAIATNTVCTGEILQTKHSGDFQFTREKYFKVLEMKTAELFALSCELAALLSGASPEMRAALKQFGTAFGTAYQIYDDCVDLFGSEAVAGKSLGTDLAKGKLTLPVLLLWEQASATERERIRRLVENWEPSSMKPMSEYLHRHDTLAASLNFMRQYLKRGCEALQALPANEGRAGLIALTEFLARQTDALGSVAESSL